MICLLALCHIKRLKQCNNCIATCILPKYYFGTHCYIVSFQYVLVLDRILSTCKVWHCYIVSLQYVLVKDWILSKYKLLHCPVRSVALLTFDYIALHPITSHYIHYTTSQSHYIAPSHQMKQVVPFYQAAYWSVCGDPSLKTFKCDKIRWA